MTKHATRTVLVVEDEPLVRELIVAEFEDAGFRVREAEDGEGAMSALDEQGADIHLLFTDIRLPGDMDGWGIAQEARRRRPDLPVIYATGYSVDAPRLVSGGCLLTKPYRPAAIIETARALGVFASAA